MEWRSVECRLGDCVVEALETQSNEFLVKKFSELCELCVCFGFGPTALPSTLNTSR